MEERRVERKPGSVYEISFIGSYLSRMAVTRHLMRLTLTTATTN